jgi:hypothetical protein
VLVASGALVCARMIFGPLSYPIPMVSPLNAEGCFGLAILLLMFIRSNWLERVETSYYKLGWYDALACCAVVAIITVVFGRSASDYFVSDDFVILHHAGTVSFNLRQLLTTAGGDGFFRPVTYVSYALSQPWCGLSPVRWHLVELAIHALNSILVFLIARGTGLVPHGAWFAATLFAIHGSCPEAVEWIAGRFDVLSTFFVLLSVVLFLKSESGPTGKRIVVRALAVSAMILGILSKESAYAGPALMALIVIVQSGGRLDWTRFRRLVPFFVCAGCLCAYRWVLFGSIGGYLTRSGSPQALSVVPATALKTLTLRIWAILFFPVNWTITPGILLKVALVLYVATLIWLALAAGNRRDLLIAASWIVISVLPPLQQLLIGADLEKARYLYLPSVGFALLLASAAQSWERFPRWGVYAIVVAFQAIALQQNLTAWDSAASKTLTACQVAAACNNEHGTRILAQGLPLKLDGVYFFKNGYPECVEMLKPAAGLRVDVRDAGPSGLAQYACVFNWDPVARALRLVQRGTPVSAAVHPLERK